MKARKLFHSTLATLVLMTWSVHPVFAEEQPEAEETICLSPFEVSSENNEGYLASESLAGTRLSSSLKDVASSINVITPQFLSDTGMTRPNVPVSITRKADALLIQFAISATHEKSEQRNGELEKFIQQLEKVLSEKSGLRYEPREVHISGANKRKTLFGKRNEITSFAHFVVFASFDGATRPYQRIKEIRDLVDKLTQGSTVIKSFDGPVGLYIRNPNQYRGELLGKVFADLENIKKGLGSDFEILPSGLSSRVQMRVSSETDIELWLDYSFSIRSMRELEAKKTKS